jgi:hypothetical protein
LWPPQRGVGLQEPNLGKTNLRVLLAYSLGICFAPSLADSFLYLLNANPACSCVYICEFQFRPIHPPLGDFQRTMQTRFLLKIMKINVREMLLCRPILLIVLKTGLCVRACFFPWSPENFANSGILVPCGYGW